MPTAEPSLRELLRELPVFATVADDVLHPSSLPLNPLLALQAELRAAMAAGVREPHAMTLSTVDAAGVPSSRVQICKDVDENGLYFATSSLSRKGLEIAATGRAAALFYWRESGRQLRLAGRAVPQSDAASAADFAARSRTSRLAALVHGDTAPSSVDDIRELAAAVDASTPDDAPPPSDWRLYALVPDEAELWQARRDRLHSRVRWTSAGGGWERGLLWP